MLLPLHPGNLRIIRLTTSVGQLALKRPAQLRFYFSEHHPAPHPFSVTQEKILSSALQRVPRHGFTPEALSLGARDAGYLEVSVQLFPRGVFDLVNYHLVTQRLALKDKVQFAQDKSLGVGTKVSILVKERLRANEPIIHQWQGALGYMSLLENIPASLKELNALSDEIWYLAGDTTVDFSWYTKRASLAAIYASSELFMTTDTSGHFVATQDFLDRRLEDTTRIGGSFGAIGQFAGFWARNSFNLARSWGMKV